METPGVVLERGLEHHREAPRLDPHPLDQRRHVVGAEVASVGFQLAAPYGEASRNRTPRALRGARQLPQHQARCHLVLREHVRGAGHPGHRQPEHVLRQHAPRGHACTVEHVRHDELHGVVEVAARFGRAASRQAQELGDRHQRDPVRRACLAAVQHVVGRQLGRDLVLEQGHAASALAAWGQQQRVVVLHALLLEPAGEFCVQEAALEVEARFAGAHEVEHGE
mmetsp:Transcript_22992/g.49756  ORF Transcript_22992/g.49756 Transcript_22992/m.49756 type:complete len:224 (+) Transcript_22992:999-1670(+)